MVGILVSRLFNMESNLDHQTNIPRLRELTEKIGEARAPESVRIWHTDGGDTTTWGLQKEPSVAVLRAHMPVGCDFSAHQHDETETLHIYKGELEVYLDGGDYGITVRAGQSVTFRPGRQHRAIATKETWLIAVTMPADAGYPDAA